MSTATAPEGTIQEVSRDLIIYVAGPMPMKDYIRGVAGKLDKLHGFRVESSWLEQEVHWDELSPQDRIQRGYNDFVEVRNCDFLVIWAPRYAYRGEVDEWSGPPSEAYAPPYAPCGTHVEFGLALAWNKEIILMTEPATVFHQLPHVRQCEDDVGELIKMLMTW